MIELSDEEKEALAKANEWMEDKDWRDKDEGFFEACILANLLNRFAVEILKKEHRII
jgi:hypothetical protein